MLRQEVKLASTPERVRARRTPRERPDTITAREEARREGGARSPTRGSMSCGVTVVAPQRKDMAEKEGKEVVRQRGIHCFFLVKMVLVRTRWKMWNGDGKEGDGEDSEGVPKSQ